MSGNTKKRILLVVRWPVGGIRTFMRYVYRSFDSEQYHFTILGPDNHELDVLEKDLEGLDLKIVRLSERPNAIELALAVTRMLLFGKYDLVHSHGFTSGICSSLPAFLFRIPHILTSHDVLSESQFKGTIGSVKKMIMGLALSLISTIHSVSHDAQANLLEFFPSLGQENGKCIVISNGIETDRFINAEPRDLHGELGLGDDVFLIGFLGRFMSQKGFVYLVDAIDKLVSSSSLSKKPLVIAFGEGGFIREEKSAISARGLSDYFCFLPFAANVAGIIKGLDVVVMPSLWEACGLLAMETLTAGTPLITSNCIGLREVVDGTPTYIVPPKNSDALAEGLKSFISNDNKLMFLNYAPTAAKRYDVDTTALLLKELIDENIQ